MELMNNGGYTPLRGLKFMISIMEISIMNLQLKTIQKTFLIDKMKRIRLYHAIIFWGICFFLTGCPIPNTYKVFIKNESTNLKPHKIFTKEFYDFKILDAYPFLDTKKKIITVNCSINNKSNQNLIININSVKLKSKKKDEFKLITTDMHLTNPFKVDSTSFNIKPNESSILVFYFTSKGNYTKKEFKKSLIKDTLILTTEVLKENHTIYLIQ